MKVLVAGASGLVGRQVVASLKQRGHWVRALSKDPGRAEPLRGVADEVTLVDATDAASLVGACRDIEVVVSALGAPVTPSGAGRRSFADVDSKANLNLLAEAQRAGARRFVYVGVYTEPVYAGTAYVAAHAHVEAAVQRSGLEHGFVRTTGVFGALAELLTMAKKGPVPLIGDGSAVTNPVDERDVAEHVVRAVEASDSSAVEVGGPEPLTRRRIAELAFEALGRRPRLVAMPVWVMRCVAWVYGLFNRRVGQLLEFVLLVATHSCVAPAAGERRLAQYFAERAKV